MEGEDYSYPEVLKKSRDDTTEDVASIRGLTFHDFSLRKELNMGIIKHGYKQPSPIQEEVIPLILAGKSVVARAKNGIGKTAAFAIPLIELCDLTDESIQTLILVPTRELAAQHQQEISFLSQYIPGFIRPLLLVGGVPITDDLFRLKEKPRIVVCTPGRCCDLMQRGQLRLDRLKHVVLDEADRLLSDSFRETVNTILSLINKPIPIKGGKGAQMNRGTFKRTSGDTIVPPSETGRDDTRNVLTTGISLKSNSSKNEKQKLPQMLLFSATFPQSLSSFVDNIPNCQKVIIRYTGTNTNNRENSTNNNEGLIEKTKDKTKEEEKVYNQLVVIGVSHYYILLKDERSKVSALMWLFQNIEIHQSFIFVRSIERANKLCSVLRECMAREYGVDGNDNPDEVGTPFAVLHSSMDTDNRLAVLGLLRSGKVRHLISTDVGTRGLDSSLVNVVINFDMPDGGGSSSGTEGHNSFGAGASKDYLHRIGRCGRYGGRGKAISFVVNDLDNLKPGELSADLVLLFKIEKELGIKITQISGNEPIE